MLHIEPIHYWHCRSIVALTQGPRIEYGFFGSRFPVGILCDPRLWGLIFKSFAYLNESPYLIADREFELVDKATKILRENRKCLMASEVIARNHAVDLLLLVAPMVERNPRKRKPVAPDERRSSEGADLLRWSSPGIS